MAPADELYRTWTTSTAGKLAQQEFPYQRMHREPAPPPKPAEKTSYVTVHKDHYREGVFPMESTTSQARYTIGTKNALGTCTTYRQVKLDEARCNQVHLGNDASRSFQSTFSASFPRPDLSSQTQGLKAPRCGMAPRLAFSEVERNFGSLTSEGTMPGTVGQRELSSETQTRFSHPGRQPQRERIITLGYSNDIGTQVSSKQTDARLAESTHYTLGDEPRTYLSETMSATAKPVLCT